MTDDNRATEDNRTLVLAFYVVVDVSQSMEYSKAITSANEILPKVADAIDSSPMLADIVRFGAMDFSDDARVVLRLGDLRNVSTLPTFAARGRTSYAAAFRLLRKEIERDVVQLRSDDFRVYRPVVFMITDGEPTDYDDELKAAYAELTDVRGRHRHQGGAGPLGVSEDRQQGHAQLRLPGRRRPEDRDREGGRGAAGQHRGVRRVGQ
jgi:hypothetical protein